ncbi:MAG: hypothetical protein JXA60_11860 [Candidatus Coatesbacteria bacterium]|nr:hypothetical protein [Candidatus Coatesbacteria bacterium]
MDIFYTADMQKLTFKELFNLSPSKFMFPLFYFLKLIGYFNKPTTIFKTPFRMIRKQEEELPSNAMELLNTRLFSFKNDFRKVFCFVGPVNLGDDFFPGMILLNSDRTILAMMIYIDYFKHSPTNPKTNEVKIALFTRTIDGEMIITSNSKPDFKGPPWVKGEYIKASDAEMIERHKIRLQINAMRSFISFPEHDIENIMHDYEKRVFEFQLQRGLYRILEPHEIEPLLKLKGKQTEDQSYNSTRNP